MLKFWLLPYIFAMLAVDVISHRVIWSQALPKRRAIARPTPAVTIAVRIGLIGRPEIISEVKPSPAGACSRKSYWQSARAFAVQRPKPLTTMLRMTAQT